MKLNKQKINDKANAVMTSYNGLKETLVLILLGAGIQEAATKLIEQRFNSAQEGLNDFINMLHQEIEESEKGGRER